MATLKGLLAEAEALWGEFQVELRRARDRRDVAEVHRLIPLHDRAKRRVFTLRAELARRRG